MWLRSDLHAKTRREWNCFLSSRFRIAIANENFYPKIHVLRVRLNEEGRDLFCFYELNIITGIFWIYWVACAFCI